MDLLQKALNKENLSPRELSGLYDYDIFTLGGAADEIRKKYYGSKVFFNVNRHINPTNICADVCRFCAFSASRKNPNPYEMSIDEIVSQVIACSNRGVKEVHIVSAHSPNYSYEWYLDMFSAVKKAVPQIHLKAMTAAEVDYLDRKFGKGYQRVLEDMVKYGVDSMPGGGAEIFDEKIRQYICKGKVSSQRWLEIHHYWHQLGKMSNATMLFGHVENREHRIDHMLRLRDIQQDRNIIERKQGGFNAFIPLLYQNQNNFLNIKNTLSGQEVLKTISIARILLENIPHIKAYWASLSLNLALVAQEFGADDVDGTIEKESIQSAGGAGSKDGIDKEMMIFQIHNAGFRAIERDALYNELQEYHKETK
ncbi:radical SAM protein [Helicobacter mustelae]|uniref:aminofutalosine synthase MqnE n=1 Tax=Helicobacter mustelae TaxID=217 RepID=UPI000DFED5CE|nr:aminofutalosine synthase MqnE [Helicobacter mustelae]STP12505.1 radical SAM protein [Helicobacter mustelae]